MARLTAPGGTSDGLTTTRLGRGAQQTADDLGDLADLVGTWIGSEGWELIAVPDTNPQGEEDFKLILRPYVEVVTFRPIGGPVPNRGGPAGNMCIYGLMYDMRITDKLTGEPLHLENGMWLNAGTLGEPTPISRTAAIPHGDALLALGTSSTAPGPPEINTPTAIPDIGPEIRAGYTDPYMNTGTPFITSDPGEVLREAIKEVKVGQTTTLSVSTANSGGIINIPFVDKNANATEFACNYWIETLDTPDVPVQQLQYWQQTNIEFLPQFGNPSQLIMWPHVNVNTLRKQ
jgi:hypothetical protein